MLLRIILLPLLARFSMICEMWAFQISYDRPLRRVDWAFILGWSQGPGCFIGRASSLGLASGLASLFFKPYQLPPQPLCTICVSKGCNVSRIGCDCHVSALCWVG